VTPATHREIDQLVYRLYGLSDSFLISIGETEAAACRLETGNANAE